MSEVIILPKCEVCGARGCLIKHSAIEIELKKFCDQSYPEPPVKDPEAWYNGCPEPVDLPEDEES